MAQVLNRAHATLLSLLVVSACAQGIESSPADDSTPVAVAGSTADGGASAQAGGSTTAGSPSAGAPNGGATSSAGAASGGSSSGSSTGGSAGAALLGGSSSGGSSAGASTTAGSSTGGSATAGASAGGASAGAGGKVGGGGGASAGSGGGAAACSGTKPESNCVCHTNNAHDYWFCPTPRTFTVGESNCVSAGLHMVKIASAAEDKWVNDTANAASFGEYYLGSTDASTPNTWTWLAGGTFWTGVANGTASGYAHWNAGEPNASGDCLVMQSNFVWDDRICTDNRTYICD